MSDVAQPLALALLVALPLVGGAVTEVQVEVPAQESAILADVLTRAAEGDARGALALLRRASLAAELAGIAAVVEGQLHESLGDVGTAADVYRAALDRFPGDPLLLRRLGVLAFRRGDLAAAERLLAQSYRAAGSAEAAFYLARIHLARGEPGSAARGWLVKAAAHDPIGTGGYGAKAVEELRRLGQPAR